MTYTEYMEELHQLKCFIEKNKIRYSLYSNKFISGMLPIQKDDFVDEYEAKLDKYTEYNDKQHFYCPNFLKEKEEFKKFVIYSMVKGFCSIPLRDKITECYLSNDEYLDCLSSSQEFFDMLQYGTTNAYMKEYEHIYNKFEYMLN